MHDQWPMLNEAGFPQTQSQQADDHITKSSMYVVPSELLPTVSAAGPWVAGEETYLHLHP